MSSKVLLLGGTGRTGRQALAQLLERGAAVRALVRSADKRPDEVRHDRGLTVEEGDLLSLSDEDLRGLVKDCAAVVSCLGHNISLEGVFGRPRDLVTSSVARVCRAIETARPDEPVRFVLMSSVSVNSPKRQDKRRGWFERAWVAVLRVLLPPAKDNQRAADFLNDRIGLGNPSVEWVIVRPDALLDGPVTEYAVHEGLVDSLFRPGCTNRANVAHFMCELVLDRPTWEKWRYGLPVVVNTG